MGTLLYIGNLHWSIDSAQLGRLLREFGRVRSAHVVADLNTGRSSEFGFVEMANHDGAIRAIQCLDGEFRLGRFLAVQEANSMESPAPTIPERGPHA